MADGGIMALEEPRQGFFLGRIVKKAKRAVKKITKSPLGKAALAAAAFEFGGPMLAKAFPSTFSGQGILGALGRGQFTGQGGLLRGIGGLFDKGKFLSPLVRADGGAGALSVGKLGLLGLGGAAIAAPFFMGGDEEEEVPETSFTETPDSIASIVNMARQQDSSLRFLPQPKFVRNFYAADGGIARIPMQEGGMMDMGGLEKDYSEGGFVPIGEEERADDVPARLSKNEFVFTADAVRAAGGGDIDKGAEVMQNMMDNLEAGGMISEESQGMNPAQEMFDQSQMLEGRLA